VERAKFQRLLQAHAEHIGALRTAQQEVERLQRELQNERAAALAAALDGQEMGGVGTGVTEMRRAASRTLQQSDIGVDPADQCAAEQRVCPSTGTIITTSAIALPFSKPLVRTRETLVGNLVATSMLQFMAARWALRSVRSLQRAPAFLQLRYLPCRFDYAGGDFIALLNSGGLRAGLQKGPVDAGMLKAITPLGNQVRFAIVNGTTIKAVLEHSVSLADTATSGKFPCVAGLRFQFDPTRPIGSRVDDVQVRRHPSWIEQVLLPEKEYTLITTDFLLGGGDVSNPTSCFRTLADIVFHVGVCRAARRCWRN
jgi:hypothetical protein